jgi:6-phosphogluconolactonase
MLEWDARRELQILETTEEAVAFAAEHWVHSAQRAIQQHGRFAVALSGGSTPKAIYKLLAKQPLDWSKILLFFSDERAVPLDHPDSNYKMALDAGMPKTQLFPMNGVGNLEQNAKDYEEKIRKEVGSFDLVMLGVGEDGHTASLFPHTTALKEMSCLVVPNYLPEKNIWRLTFTYPCINQSGRAVIYALGENKQSIVPLVLDAAIHSPFPASAIGTSEHKALWILDKSAARLLK